MDGSAHRIGDESPPGGRGSSRPSVDGVRVRAEYRPPRLVVHGSVCELTRNILGNEPTDGIFGTGQAS
jgi:hypothetical protein